MQFKMFLKAILKKLFEKTKNLLQDDLQIVH